MTPTKKSVYLYSQRSKARARLAGLILLFGTFLLVAGLFTKIPALDFLCFFGGAIMVITGAVIYR